MIDGDSIPIDAELTRTTRWFDETTVPAGLLAAHQIAAKTWGRLIVESGALDFTFEEGDDVTVSLRAGDVMVIPPSRAHHVTPGSTVKFCVEFYRESGA